MWSSSLVALVPEAGFILLQAGGVNCSSSSSRPVYPRRWLEPAFARVGVQLVRRPAAHGVQVARPCLDLLWWAGSLALLRQLRGPHLRLHLHPCANDIASRRSPFLRRRVYASSQLLRQGWVRPCEGNMPWPVGGPACLHGACYRLTLPLVTFPFSFHFLSPTWTVIEGLTTPVAGALN